MLLLSVHLAMNHAAVRSVSMRSLNRQRANIVLTNLMEDDKVLTPQQISQQERIFEWDGILRWKNSVIIGKAYIGVTMQCLMGNLVHAHTTTGAIRDADHYLRKLIDMFKDEDFLFWCNRPHGTGYILLKESAKPTAQLKAWAVALLVLHRLKTHSHATRAEIETNETTFDVIQTTLHGLTIQWSGWVERLQAVGWDVQVSSLETLSGTRIRSGAGSDEKGNNGY